MNFCENHFFLLSHKESNIAWPYYNYERMVWGDVVVGSNPTLGGSSFQTVDDRLERRNRHHPFLVTGWNDFQNKNSQVTDYLVLSVYYKKRRKNALI